MNDCTPQLNEMFEMLPINLEEIGIADGEKIYSNNDIAERVYKQAKRRIKVPQIVEKIREGMQTKKIMIGYTDKSKFRFIFRRVSGWTSYAVFGRAEDFYAGWYSKHDGKIAIVLDNNVTLTGNNFIPVYPVLVHELVHMSVTEDPKQFFEATKRDYLVPYYAVVCEQLSGKSVNLKNVHMVTQALVTEMESKPVNSSGMSVDNAAQIWVDFWRAEGYSKDQAKDFVFVMFGPFVEYCLKKRMKPKYRNQIPSMINYYFSGYDSIGAPSSRNMTLPGQEACYPSEIVSVASRDFLTRDLITAIQKIDMSN